MNNRRSFRIAVLGTPQTERWLLVRAFAESRGSQCAYELVVDAAVRRPDMFVVDSENEQAVARWAALDPKGAVPAAFLGRVHPRAKCALLVARPHTSGSVLDALNRLERRFLQVTDAERTVSRSDAARFAFAAA